YLETQRMPLFLDLHAWRRFIQRVKQFFVQDQALFKRIKGRRPALVILNPAKRQEVLTEAHEGSRHRGVFGVFHLIQEHFFWPHMYQDVKQHVGSCHECQI
ncbi:hypothetical protein JAAARDRAFT_111416, partial [Jaapia argillacea MUCL 33604]